jgi:hypothetical protein
MFQISLTLSILEGGGRRGKGKEGKKGRKARGEGGRKQGGKKRKKEGREDGMKEAEKSTCNGNWSKGSKLSKL